MLGPLKEKRISLTVTVVFQAGRPSFFSYLEQRFKAKKILA